MRGQNIVNSIDAGRADLTVPEGFTSLRDRREIIRMYKEALEESQTADKVRLLINSKRRRMVCGAYLAAPLIVVCV